MGGANINARRKRSTKNNCSTESAVNERFAQVEELLLLAEFVECCQNDREDLAFVPILEAVVTGGLGWVLPLRQSVPLRSRTENPEDAVQDFTVRPA